MDAVISLRSQNPSWLSVLSFCLRLDPREPESHGTLLQEVLSTGSSTSGPSKSQEEPAEPPNQGKSPPYIQGRICRLRQAFGKDWRISLTIQIAKNVVRTTIGGPSEYEDHSIDPSYELQTCNLPNEPDHPGIVFAPDRKKHGFFLLAMPKALATVRDGKLEMLDSHHPVDMNRVWNLEPVGQLSDDAPQGALATYHLLGKTRIIAALRMPVSDPVRVVVGG
jgi:hypothetical protein